MSRNVQRETLKQDWDTYWAAHEPSGYVNYTPEITRTITSQLGVQGKRVLEIGVGTGGDSSMLAKLGANVHIIDFSRKALILAISTATETQVEMVATECDARHLPFESDSFDLVFHQGFLEHFEDPIPLIVEQNRVLKQGGYVLIDVPQKYNLYTSVKHRAMRQGQWEYGGWETEFTYGDLCRRLRSLGFRVIDAYGRGYYPRLFYMLRHLHKAEERVLPRRLVPRWVWQRYDTFWTWFERSRLVCIVYSA